MEYEAIVVGGGAAGLSAALVLGRTRRTVLVCDEGHPRNAPSGEVRGFLSREGIHPRELLRIGREQIARYPSVEFADAYIKEVRDEGGDFVVTDQTGRHVRARALLLATGMYDDLPKIEGLLGFWGRAAFVCPYCDAWEFRDKTIAALGTASRAGELAQELRQWSDDVCVVEQSSVARIDGTDAPEIVCNDGSTRKCDAIFLCAPLRLRHPLVDQLGLRLRDDGAIDVDECGRTSVRNCYAAGDAVATVHQVAIAVASGVRAAMAINEDFLEEKSLRAAG